jgi:hypothetical protein
VARRLGGRLITRPYLARREVIEAYAVMCRANRNFATFNGVGFDAAGNPDPAELRLAWATGARAFRLTPR